MKHLVEKRMPANDDKRKWLSVGIAVVVAELLTVWAIYGIGNYGIALFILIPLLVGAVPVPMKELSFWDIDASHLHDYFVSKQGPFELIRLPDGNTSLTGTTWYYHNITPSFYWQMWSSCIIHKIHYRVLSLIKKNAERSGD